MKTTNILIFFTVIYAVQGGGPSPCEPFVSNFQSFQQVWLNLVDHYQKLAIDISSAYPVFTPALVVGLECQTNEAIKLAGNAISRLSGINHFNIDSILNGTLAPEFGTQLDCITKEIIYMQQRLLTIFDGIVPLLEDSVQAETTPNDCAEVITRLEPYVDVGNSVSKRVGELLIHNRLAFSLINMEDLYKQFLSSFVPCLWKVIGTGLGSLLNSDGRAVTQYLESEISILPYPFNCFEDGLSFTKNNFNQTFHDLYFGVITFVDFQLH